MGTIKNLLIMFTSVSEPSNDPFADLKTIGQKIIPSDIWKAIKTLTPPDENMAKAADARQEIDLRIGCAYTRYQTLLLRDSVPEVNTVVSYGPCQFPTLGFVVERYLQRHVFNTLYFHSRTSFQNHFGQLQ